MFDVRALWDHLSDGVKYALDTVSIVALLGSLVSVLPAIATVLTIMWTGIRIYETNTVQRWLGKADK